MKEPIELFRNLVPVKVNEEDPYFFVVDMELYQAILGKLDRLTKTSKTTKEVCKRCEAIKEMFDWETEYPDPRWHE